MLFDYSMLRGKIVQFYGTQQKFACAIGLSERSLSLKLNGKHSWTQHEINLACELLSIFPSEIHLYFFTPLVQTF